MHSRRAIGFTLIEAMVALAVAAILLTIAIPSFTNAALSSQLRSTSNSLMASIHLARSEAIKRNAIVTLCVSTDGTTCTTGEWQQGWIVLSGITLQQEPALSSDLRVLAGGVSTISFQPTGAGASATTFKICRSSPSVGHEERVVTLDASGRPSTKRTTTAVCP